jgi:hypothetical protein
MAELKMSPDALQLQFTVSYVRVCEGISAMYNKAYYILENRVYLRLECLHQIKSDKLFSAQQILLFGICLCQSFLLDNLRLSCLMSDVSF